MRDSVPPGTLWPIGTHTAGKHIVLKAYLDAWFPILGTTQQRILVIDGFAGPGRYAGGEDGSPIIALKALRDHPFRPRIRAEIVFLFIEKEPGRADHLRASIRPLAAELGTRVRVEVMTGDFDETMTAVLQHLDEQKHHLAPAFVMVDPFGISHTALSVIASILENPRSEVHISFMWEFFNRFKATDEFPPHLDGLFGCTDWRHAAGIPDWRRRRDFIFGLYKRQLKAAGAEHVVHFERFDQGTLVYAVFFASKHALGCDKMKAAIWKADPLGGCAFVGGKDPAAGELFSRIWNRSSERSATCSRAQNGARSTNSRRGLRPTPLITTAVSSRPHCGSSSATAPIVVLRCRGVQLGVRCETPLDVLVRTNRAQDTPIVGAVEVARLQMEEA